MHPPIGVGVKTLQLGDNSHRVLKLAIGARHGCPPSPSWKRPRGRARDTWLKPFMHSGTSIQSQWDSAVQRGHGQSAQRLFPDSRL